MEIAVVGAGAMGSLFGGRLAAGNDVTLVNRGAEHVAAINERGLIIVDDTGEDSVSGDDDDSSTDDRPSAADGVSVRTETVDVPATTNPADVGTVDLLVLFVKSHQTAAAMADAAPLIGPETAVLTLQNGLGNAETIAERVPEARVLAGVTTHGAIRETPGRVRHTGAGDTTLGRYFDGDETARDEGGRLADERLRAIADRFTAAGLPTEIVDDAPTLLWEKALVNAGINAPTALARVTNGQLSDTGPGRRLVERAVTEAATVARANGYDVREDAIDYALSVAERTAVNRSSMLQDVEAGRRTEVEALYGAVVERGERVDVDAPVNRTLADLVRLAEAGESIGD